MDKSDDLSICKKIAEIEGLYNHTSETKIKHVMVKDNSVTWMIRFTEYNPLTDDSLCFKLMVKYKVKSYFKNDGWVTGLINDNGEPHSFNMDESPNKAICLAIIESQKDQS